MPGRIIPGPPQPDDNPDRLAEERELWYAGALDVVRCDPAVN
jgi:hypothetical protein